MENQKSRDTSLSPEIIISEIYPLPLEVDTAQLTSIINHTCNCRKAERPNRRSTQLGTFIATVSVENFIFENISAEISAEIWQKWCRKLSPPKIISAELNLRRNISPVRYFQFKVSRVTSIQHNYTLQSTVYNLHIYYSSFRTIYSSSKSPLHVQLL